MTPDVHESLEVLTCPQPADWSMAELEDLYVRSADFPLEPEFAQRIGDTTLTERSLRFLGGLVERLAPRTVLEFGSGLSTAFLARRLAKTPGARLVSVEDSEFFLAKTRETVGKADHVSFLWAPIASFEFAGRGFTAYDPQRLGDLADAGPFDLVVVDGPMGRRYGREAALYQIAPWIGPDTLVVLDDAKREPEQTALGNWRRVWGAGLESRLIEDHCKGLALLRLRTPRTMDLSAFAVRETSVA